MLPALLAAGDGLSQSSYGLRFSSHEVVQEKRTALNLTSTGPLCFRKKGEIAFDFNLLPYKESYFGYILRIVADNDENVDLVYNQQDRSINFLIGENFSKKFYIDSAALFNKWTRIAVSIDPASREAAVAVEGRQVARGHLQTGNPACIKVLFGTNAFEGFQTTDIPPMNIRDIVVKEGDAIRYNWPLSEVAGDTATDRQEGKTAAVKNPVWINPRHNHWRLAQTWEVNGYPAVAFDRNTEVFYLVTGDTLYHLSFKNGQAAGTALSQRLENLLPGNQAVFDPYNNKLYSFYADERKAGTYDAANRRWDVAYTPGGLTVFWQANKFFSRSDSSLYILCGYGQMQYKNLVQRYRPSAASWDTVSVSGERLVPRYLAAVGATTNGDTAYILGGYGSNSGSQVINPRHQYDLMAFYVKDHSFHKLYQLKEPGVQFAFANSLVPDPDGQHYYALTFPDNQFHTSLQLIRGSLSEPVYTQLADEIPYSFHDIRSFADLYFCSTSKLLTAVTMHTNSDQRTTVNVYTLEFPGAAVATAVSARKQISRWYIWASVISLALVIFIIYYYRFRRKPSLPATQATAPPAPVIATPEPPAEAPGQQADIHCFGTFEVLDKDGQDLTRSFTPLLKELFLLIAIHTIRTGKGISSDKLYATLWPDKSSKEAQNNRSVNMVKLKAILDKLAPCTFVKEADRWSLQYDATRIRIDLAVFQELLAQPRPLSKTGVKQMLAILRRGAFLPDAGYGWLEDIQSGISADVLDVLTGAAPQFKAAPELLIEMADGIFLVDPVSEEALLLKCSSLVTLGRHSLAKALFNKFTKEYLHLYGEEFPHPFTDFSGEK